ncbi:MAG: response regulator [Alphaproteobacteria bacterium]|nr:response regulator [Alphaproteobacteria bacterium]MCW5743456.1 response regulator [Alphaproteobacteria bacterium]
MPVGKSDRIQIDMVSEKLPHSLCGMARDVIDKGRTPAKPVRDVVWGPSMSANALKILVVEDEVGILEEIAEFLRRRRYDVSTSGDLGGARRALADSSAWPDVVVTDVKLPDGDGLELVREIGANAAPRPRLIVMTGHLDQDSARDARQQGAEAVLMKPFALRALLRQIDGSGAVPAPA